MALIRKLPTPSMGMAMFSSPTSLSSSILVGDSTSASSLMGESIASGCALMGTHWPLILISAGAYGDR
jgi:hypothetical protein